MSEEKPKKPHPANPFPKGNQLGKLSSSKGIPPKNPFPKGNQWRFQPGQAGCTNSPGKYGMLTPAIRAWLAEEANLKTVLDAITREIKNGNSSVIKLVWERTDGLPKQTIEIAYAPEDFVNFASEIMARFVPEERATECAAWVEEWVKERN